MYIRQKDLVNLQLLTRLNALFFIVLQFCYICDKDVIKEYKLTRNLIH